MGEQIAGWTENFWSTLSTDETAKLGALTLADLLLAVHGIDALLMRVKVQQTTPPYRFQFYKIGSYGTGGVSGPVEKRSSDYFTLALMLQARNRTGRGYTRQWLNGIPDALWSQGGSNFGQIAPGLTALLTFLNGLGSPITMRVRSNAVGVDVITGFNKALGQLTIPGLVTDSPVLVAIKGVKGCGCLTGNMILSQVPETTNWIIRGWNPRAKDCLDVDLVNSEVRIVDWIYPEGQWTAVRVSSRKVGRPFGLLRGRQRKTC